MANNVYDVHCQQKLATPHTRVRSVGILASLGLRLNGQRTDRYARRCCVLLHPRKARTPQNTASTLISKTPIFGKKFGFAENLSKNLRFETPSILCPLAFTKKEKRETAGCREISGKFAKNQFSHRCESFKKLHDVQRNYKL